MADSPIGLKSYQKTSSSFALLCSPFHLAGVEIVIAFESLDRRALEEGLERAGIPPCASEVDRRLSHLRRGCYWGSQEFAHRVLELADAALRKKGHPSGRGIPAVAPAEKARRAARLKQEGSGGRDCGRPG